MTQLMIENKLQLLKGIMSHIQIDTNGLIISGINEIFNVFTVTWLGVAIVFFTFQIVKYHLFKRRILMDAVLFTDQRMILYLVSHRQIMQL